MEVIRVQFFGYTIQNSVLYSYALSFSFLMVAVMLPFLSGVADYTGRKKTFMKFFVWMGSLSCIGLYFFDGVTMLWWGILCSIFASIGYSGSLVFYDAFLPEIVTEDRYDTTSARGYSMGYYGSVILMIICLMLILNFESFGFSQRRRCYTFYFFVSWCLVDWICHDPFFSFAGKCLQPKPYRQHLDEGLSGNCKSMEKPKGLSGPEAVSDRILFL